MEVTRAGFTFDWAPLVAFGFFGAVYATPVAPEGPAQGAGRALREIGIKGYPLSRVVADLQIPSGFQLIKQYR